MLTFAFMQFVASICIEVPEEHHEAISGGNIQFTCVSCHFKAGQRAVAVAAGPYFMRIFSLLMLVVLMRWMLTYVLRDLLAVAS